MFHASILAPIVLTIILLMVTARKIAMLCGVLHLNEDAVADVLAQMERVKSFRKRIQDTLASTKIKNREPNPQAAAEVLQKATSAEVSILEA